MSDIFIFQITPYSQTVYTYINSISSSKVYTLFNSNTSYDILTAALYKIYLLHPDSPDYTPDIRLFSSNLYTLDIYPYVFVSLFNSFYINHSYIWTVKNNGCYVTNIISPSSIISYKLLNEIKSWVLSRSTSPHYIRILHPSRISHPTLIRAGFIQSKSNNPKYAWLFDNRSIGSTPIVLHLLFRSYDFILPIII